MSSSSHFHLKNQPQERIKRSTLLDKLVMIVALVEPLITIGQIIQLWQVRDARGNSLLTWSIFLLSACIWLAYGFKIKNKPLIVSSTLWVITETIVVTEILYFS